MSHPFGEQFWLITSTANFLGRQRVFLLFKYETISRKMQVDTRAAVEEGPGPAGSSAQLGHGALLSRVLHRSLLSICSFYCCMTVWIFIYFFFGWHSFHSCWTPVSVFFPSFALSVWYSNTCKEIWCRLEVRAWRLVREVYATRFLEVLRRWKIKMFWALLWTSLHINMELWLFFEDYVVCVVLHIDF